MYVLNIIQFGCRENHSSRFTGVKKQDSSVQTVFIDLLHTLFSIALVCEPNWPEVIYLGEREKEPLACDNIHVAISYDTEICSASLDSRSIIY